MKRKGFSKLKEAFPLTPLEVGASVSPVQFNRDEHLEKTEAQLPLNHRSCLPLKD